MSELITFLTEKCCQGMPAPQVARIGQAVAACCSPAKHRKGVPHEERPARNRPVAVIGAGPVGLAAAAHLLERGFTPLVFEAGATIARAFRELSRHVQLFSPWRYNIDRAARRLLEA